VHALAEGKSGGHGRYREPGFRGKGTKSKTEIVDDSFQYWQSASLIVSFLYLFDAAETAPRRISSLVELMPRLKFSSVTISMWLRISSSSSSSSLFTADNCHQAVEQR
jgi:hypothetical protein